MVDECTRTCTSRRVPVDARHRPQVDVHDRQALELVVRSVNVTDLVYGVSDRVQALKIELLDATYRWAGVSRMDQTLTPVAESAIGIVVRKRTADGLALRGRIRRAG